MKTLPTCSLISRAIWRDTIYCIFARITLLSLFGSIYRSSIEASGSTLCTHHLVVLLNLFYSDKGLRFRRYELFVFATANIQYCSLFRTLFFDFPIFLVCIFSFSFNTVLLNLNMFNTVRC